MKAFIRIPKIENRDHQVVAVIGIEILDIQELGNTERK